MAFGFSPSQSRSTSSSPVQSKARSESKPARPLPTTNCLPQGSRITPPSTPPSRLPSRSTSSRPPASPLTPPASSSSKVARPPPTRTFTLPPTRNASIQSPPLTPPASLPKTVSATASPKSPSPAAGPSGIPRPPQSFLQRITSRSNHASPAPAPVPAPAPTPPAPIPAPVGTSRVLGLAIKWDHPHPSSHLARSPSIDLPRSSSEGLSVSPTSYPYERKRDRKSWSEQFAGLETRRVGVRMGSLDGRDVPDQVEVVDLDIEVEGGSEEEGEADEFGMIGRSMRFGNSGRAGSSFDAASEGGWGGVPGERTSLDGMRPTWTRGPSMSSASSSSTSTMSPQISAALFGTRSSGSGTPIRMSPSASLSSLANIGPPIPRGPNHLITHSRSADSLAPTPVLLPPTFTPPPPPPESPPPTIVPLPASPSLDASPPLSTSPSPSMRGNAGFRPPSTRRTYTPPASTPPPAPVELEDRYTSLPPASTPPPAPVELEDRYTSLPPRRTIRGGRTIQRRADSPTAAWMARAEQEDIDAARDSDSSSVRTSEESSRATTTDATSTEEHDAGAEEEERLKMREEARKKLVGLAVVVPVATASDAEDEVFSTPPLSPSTSSTPPSPAPITRGRTSKDILPPPAYKLGIPRSPRSLQIARDFSPPPRSAPLPPVLSPTPSYQPLSPTCFSEEGWTVSISSSPLPTPNADGSITYTLTLRPPQPQPISPSTPPLSPSPSSPPARTLRVPTERGTKLSATAPKGTTSLNLCLPMGEPGATGGRLTFLSLPPRGEMEREGGRRESVGRFGKGGRTEWVGRDGARESGSELARVG